MSGEPEREAVRVTLLDIKRKPGRPSTGKRKRMIYCTDDEREKIGELLHRLRENKAPPD